MNAMYMTESQLWMKTELDDLQAELENEKEQESVSDHAERMAAEERRWEERTGR